jgi:hypothetical protein
MGHVTVDECVGALIASGGTHRPSSLWQSVGFAKLISFAKNRDNGWD